MTLTHKDKTKSVEEGKKIEEWIRAVHDNKYKCWSYPLPKFSDLDYMVTGRGEPFFLEVKGREKYYELAISPERKYFAAKYAKKHLKMNTWAIFWFRPYPKKFYIYNLLYPKKFDMVKRTDRDEEGMHGFYRSVKVIDI